MRTLVKILIIVALLATATFLLIFFLTKSTQKTPTRPKPDDKIGTIFIMTEAGGFDIDDFRGLPSNLDKYFKKGVVIAPNFKDPSDTVAIWKKGADLLKSSGITNVTFWVNIYFGKPGDGLPEPATCNAASPASANTCQNSLIDYLSTNYMNIQDYPLEGIFSDTEVGDTAKIVKGMETASDKFNLKLGWTSSAGKMKQDNPNNEGTRQWDFSLGQIYTDTTNQYYDGPCVPNDNFWSLLTQHEPSCKGHHCVPMVCGAGDCQEVPDQWEKNCPPGPSGTCIDERLPPKAISELLAKGFSTSPFTNFAIWYGTVAVLSSTQACTKKLKYSCCLGSSPGYKTSCIKKPIKFGTCN